LQKCEQICCTGFNVRDYRIFVIFLPFQIAFLGSVEAVQLEFAEMKRRGESKDDSVVNTVL